MSSSARYRHPAQEETTDLKISSTSPTDPVAQEKAELKEAVKEQAVKTSNSLSVLDILRILGGILLLSSGVSYLTTSGTSMTWGYNPWWTRAREWKALMVRSHHMNYSQHSYNMLM